MLTNVPTLFIYAGVCYAEKRGSGRHGSYHRLLTAPPLPLLLIVNPPKFSLSLQWDSNIQPQSHFHLMPTYFQHLRLDRYSGTFTTLTLFLCSRRWSKPSFALTIVKTLLLRMMHKGCPYIFHVSGVLLIQSSLSSSWSKKYFILGENIVQHTNFTPGGPNLSCRMMKAE